MSTLDDSLWQLQQLDESDEIIPDLFHGCDTANLQFSISAKLSSRFPWHPDVPIPTDIWERSLAAEQRANEALQLFRQYKNPPSISEEELATKIDELNLLLSSYVPGSCSLFLAGWKRFLEPLGQDAEAASVLDTLEFGYKLDLVICSAAPHLNSCLWN